MAYQINKPAVLLILGDSEKSRIAITYLKQLGKEQGKDFVVVDVKKLQVLPHVSRDLGIERFPSLLTSSGVFEGLEAIRRNGNRPQESVPQPAVR